VLLPLAMMNKYTTTLTASQQQDLATLNRSSPPAAKAAIGWSDPPEKVAKNAVS